jgi:hypothetical protein
MSMQANASLILENRGVRQNSAHTFASHARTRLAASVQPNAGGPGLSRTLEGSEKNGRGWSRCSTGPNSPGADISHHLVIYVFRPALLFESAYAIHVHVFKNNLGAVILSAASVLVLSTVLTAALMIGLTSGSWAWGCPRAVWFELPGHRSGYGNGDRQGARRTMFGRPTSSGSAHLARD